MNDSALEPDLSVYADRWSVQEVEEAKSLQGPIWVVGGSGFIGSKLFFSLSRIRSDVYAVSQEIEISWRLLNFPSANRIALDITNPKEVSQAINAWRPKTVFNLAAYGGYERQSNRGNIHLVNYLGTLNLVTALLESGCEAFVMAGSSSEYGLNCAAPSEDGPVNPNSDYAVSKIACSSLLKFYGEFESFPCAHLRLYSVYGPWEERDRLIPRLVSMGLQGQLIPFVDASITRDFVYVDDCTQAFVKAALISCRSRPGSIYNIATGVKTSLAEVATIARERMNIAPEPRFGSMANRKWDLSDWYGNPEKAGRELGWSAKTPFRQGLDLTINWEQRAAAVVRFKANPTKKRKISAVVACYKDNLAIPQMYERLKRVFEKIDLDYEIIFVNDSSPTGDEEEIRRLCDRDAGVIGISHSRNFGSQSAFVSGLELSTGDAAVLLDGDLQDPPELIEALVEKWQAGYEIVYGVRIKRNAAWHMQILYKLFYRVFKSLSDIKMPIDAGDFSLMDRKAVEHLLRFPERDAFLRGLRAWIGFRQTGVEYVRPERAFGKSTNNLLKNFWWAKKAIFSFSSKPLHYIQGIGLAIFGLSALLTAYYLLNYLLNPSSRVPGITTIILLVLGVGGIQIFSLSIIGDYIGKILEEAKARPRFIRSKLLIGRETLQSQADISRFVAERESLRRNLSS
jgi:dolichol-phosphate mannosyltransferase